MARLPNAWSNTYIQESLTDDTGTSFEVHLAPQQASARSLGHIILDLSVLAAKESESQSVDAEIRWGIYFGEPGTWDLNQPAINGDRWLTLGNRQVTSGSMLVGGADSGPIWHDLVYHWSAEIHSQRTMEFGSQMLLCVERGAGFWPDGSSLRFRGYARVLEFYNP